MNTWLLERSKLQHFIRYWNCIRWQRNFSVQKKPGHIRMPQSSSPTNDLIRLLGDLKRDPTHPYSYIGAGGISCYKQRKARFLSSQKTMPVHVCLLVPKGDFRPNFYVFEYIIYIIILGKNRIKIIIY